MGFDLESAVDGLVDDQDSNKFDRMQIKIVDENDKKESIKLTAQKSCNTVKSDNCHSKSPSRIFNQLGGMSFGPALNIPIQKESAIRSHQASPRKF